MRDGQIVKIVDNRTSIEEEVVKHADDHHLEGVRLPAVLKPQPVLAS